MQNIWIKLCIIGATALASGTALADHNSKWGEGWANMPNDIHNTRIDTLGDSDSFRDFVKFGNGADSVNRFKSDDSLTAHRKSKQKTSSFRNRSALNRSARRGGGRRR
jgi:hypothetical protein